MKNEPWSFERSRTAKRRKSRSALFADRQIARQDDRILTPVVGGIVAFPRSDLIETQLGIKMVGGGIGHAHLEQRDARLLLPGKVEQEQHHALAETAPLVIRMYADIEDMTFAHGDRHDAVADNALR